MRENAYMKKRQEKLMKAREVEKTSDIAMEEESEGIQENKNQLQRHYSFFLV